jgi:hypothetical protein
MNDPDAVTAAFVAAAERVLSDAFGGPIRLGEHQSLRDKYRNRVLRCPVMDGPAGVPASVIVKAAVGGENEGAHDPDRDGPGGPAWRFANERAGTRFLNEQVSDPPLAARLFGADFQRSLIVLEDLGDGPCLADRLQGDDADAAVASLRCYARSLGRLHAQTMGGEAAWRRLRAAKAGEQPARTRKASGGQSTPPRCASAARRSAYPSRPASTTKRQRFSKPLRPRPVSRLCARRHLPGQPPSACVAR